MAWRDHWWAWRDRLLQSPRFHAWASATPGVRLIARRRARALFDVCAGFVYTQILLAAVRLDLFAALRDGPRPLADIAQLTGLTIDAGDRLLRATTALGLTEERSRDGEGPRYGLGALGAALLGNPGIPAMVEHHALLYADLADPVALLKGTQGPGKLAAFWGYAGADQPGALSGEAVAAYSDLMAASQTFIAGEALAAYDFTRHRQLLDVGGGAGAFARAVTAASPQLSATVFDLPSVAARAQAALADAPRVTAVGGDFLRDSLPDDADLITLVRVVHDHDDPAVTTLLRSVRAALAPGGRVLVIEPMADAQGAAAMGDAYFGFYLLAMGSGRPRTQAEIIALLRRAGFQRVRPRATGVPLLTSVLVAE